MGIDVLGSIKHAVTNTPRSRKFGRSRITPIYPSGMVTLSPMEYMTSCLAIRVIGSHELTWCSNDVGLGRTGSEARGVVRTKLITGGSSSCSIRDRWLSLVGASLAPSLALKITKSDDRSRLRGWSESDESLEDSCGRLLAPRDDAIFSKSSCMRKDTMTHLTLMYLAFYSAISMFHIKVRDLEAPSHVSSVTRA